MNFVLKPWQLLLLILAGWINRHQQDAIEYLLTENQVLREKLGKGRILLNNHQSRTHRPQVGIIQVSGKPSADHAFDRRSSSWLFDSLKKT